jgi:hypothetical protein
MEATESLLGGSLVKARRPALLAERAEVGASDDLSAVSR